MYFSMMPQMLINLYGTPYTYKQVTDITTRVVGSKEIKNNVFLYDYYDIQDGETPEIIADKLYDNPMLHWVILLCNDIIDPVYDWILPQDGLLRHTIATYGIDNISDTHHLEDENGNWVNDDYVGYTRISNFQYEDMENEKKRTIKVLQPIYVNSFVSEIEAKLRNTIE